MVGVIWRGRAKQCFAVNVNVAVTLAVIVTMVRMVWTRRVIVGDATSQFRRCDTQLDLTRTCRSMQLALRAC